MFSILRMLSKRISDVVHIIALITEIKHEVQGTENKHTPPSLSKLEKERKKKKEKNQARELGAWGAPGPIKEGKLEAERKI